MSAGLGVAARMGVELVVATCLGGGIGYFADSRLSTGPVFTIVGVAMGTVAGVRNMMRAARELEEDGKKAKEE
ncbi:MAG: AtpZ/AtpI family protein [Leptospirillia bacterium]